MRPSRNGSVKASSTFLGNAFALEISAKLFDAPATYLPKNLDACPTSSASMSITGPPFGPIVVMGTLSRTRSVKTRSRPF